MKEFALTSLLTSKSEIPDISAKLQRLEATGRLEVQC
jgi:hypothetical protein